MEEGRDGWMNGVVEEWMDERIHERMDGGGMDG